MWNDLEQTDSSPLQNVNFQSLQNFPDYTTVDDNFIMTKSTRTLDKTITDATTIQNMMKEDDKQEEDDEPVQTPTLACST